MSSSSSSTIQKCEGCRSALPRREHLRCAICGCFYDLQCGNVSQKRFNLMERKDSWKCPKCTSMQPKVCNINTPVRCGAVEDMVKDTARVFDDDSNVTKRTKRSGASETVEQNDANTLSAEDTRLLYIELKAIRIEMSLFRELMTELNDSFKKQSARIDELESRISNLESTVTDSKVGSITRVEETISQLKLELCDKEQSSLLNDLEISGINEATNENATSIVLTIAKKLSVDLDERDIVSAERVGPPTGLVEGRAPTKPRPLVIRFTRRAVRDSLLKAARVRRRISTEGMELPGATRIFYINERLTKFNRQLFYRTREHANQCKWKYVWTRDGKVFARQDEGKARHRIRNEEDLIRVFGER